MKTRPSCNVCGELRDVRPIDRDELRPGVAHWIERLCDRCRHRFRRPVRKTNADDGERLAEAA
jgi:CRISPR/Cas system-associated protein Cas10 (large subunit of type III CRISPR-Cas system)